MRIPINKIYNYLFGDWADIDKQNAKLLKHLKLPEDLTDIEKQKLIDERIQKNTEKTKKEILDFFASVNLPRHIIKAANNTNLEKILYNNDAKAADIKGSPTEFSPYSFSNEEYINNRLNHLENQYGLLQDEKHNIPDQTRHMFHAYFKICKIIGDVIEKNNNEPNDSVAFNHAYKILVLFGNDPKMGFGLLENYLEKFNYFNRYATPLHDALTLALPIIRTDKIHLEEWLTLIRRNGPKALKLFNMAPAIEKQLGNRCPITVEEAIDAIQEISFKNAKKYPALASLFIKYNLDEKLFDRSLQVQLKHKMKDNLPNIKIKGSDIKKEYSEYELVKLPMGDPRAYILGHLTNCCQSMGGNSEKCVIDGITRENNGFYVLLKRKKKEIISDDSTDERELKSESKFDKIDYQHYEIVGQSYAWLSKQNNLVFDSWENLSPERDNKIIFSLLLEFAKKTTEEKSHNIMRVLIGTGGKTPAQLKNQITSFPEEMKEGKQYGDSNVQSTIYCNETRRYELVNEVANIFYQSCEQKNAETKQLLKWITAACYSEIFVNEAKLLLTPQNIKILLAVSFDKLSKLSWHHLIMLMNANLFSPENIHAIPESKMGANSVIKSWIKIHKSGFEIDEPIRIQSNYNLKKNIAEIIQILSVLKQKGIYDIHSIRKRVLQSFEKNKTIDECEQAVRILNDAKIEMNPIISHYVFEHYNIMKAVDETKNAYELLRKANLENNSEILKTVFEGSLKIGERVPKIIQAVEILKENRIYDNEILRKAILSDRDAPETSALEMVKAIKSLEDANVKVDSIVSSVFLTKHPYSRYQNLVPQIIELDKLLINANLQNHPKVKAEVFKVEYVHQAKKIIDTYQSLQNKHLEKEDDLLDTVLSRWFLWSGYESYVNTLISAFIKLKEEKISGDNQIRTIVLSKGDNSLKYTESLINGLKILNENKLNLSTEIKAEFLNSHHPEACAKSIVMLNNENIMDKNELRIEILSHPCCQELAEAAVILNKAEFLDDLAIRKKVLSTYSRIQAAKAVAKLKELRIEKNELLFNQIIDSRNPESAAFAIGILRKAKLENNTIIKNIVIQHYHPQEIALSIIKARKILNEEKLDETEHYFIFDKVFHYHDPLAKAEEFKKAYIFFRKFNIENEDFILHKVINHFSPSKLVQELENAFSMLSQENLLDHSNFKLLVMKHESPKSLAKAILHLKKVNLEDDAKIVSVITSKTYYPEQYAQGIALLKEAKLDNDSILINAVFNSRFPIESANIIKELNELKVENILSILPIIQNYKDPVIAMKVVRLLHSNNILDLLNKILQVYDPESLAKRLINSLNQFIDKNIVLDRDIQIALVESNQPEQQAKVIVDSILLLKQANLENDAKFRNIIFNKHSSPDIIKKIFSAFALLKEANLLNDEVVKSAVIEDRDPIKMADLIIKLIKSGLNLDLRFKLIHCRNHDDTIFALKLLQDAKIEDINIKSKIIHAHHSHEDFARAFIKLHEENLLNETQIVNKVLNSYSPLKEVSSLILSAKLLISASLQHDQLIKAKVFDFYHPEEMAKEIIAGVSLLKEAMLDNDNEVYRKVMNSHSPEKEAKELIAAINILKEAKLENDTAVRAKLFYSYNYAYIAKELVSGISILKEAGLIDDKDIYMKVFHAHQPSRTATELVGAINALKDANLLESKKIYNKVFHSHYPDEEAKLYVKTISSLKKTGLYEDESIQDVVLNDYNPHRTAEIILSAFQIISEAGINKPAEALLNLIKQFPIIRLEKEARNFVKITNENEFKSLLTFPDKQKFELFANKLQMSIESMPDKTWSLFTSTHYQKKLNCLDAIEQFKKDLHCMTKQKTMENLLVIIVKFYGELVNANSDRYLKELRSYLREIDFRIPDDLYINHDGIANDTTLFNATLDNFKKLFRSVELENKLK